MKKAQIKFFVLAIVALGISLIANISTSRAGVKAAKLTIVNKTDSRIDAIHIAEGDDVLPQHEEILMPEEKITVDFDKLISSNTDKYQVKLVFADGKQCNLQQFVFDEDSTWEITEDGNHRN